MLDIILTLPLWIISIGGVLLLVFQALGGKGFPNAFFAGVVLISALCTLVMNSAGYVHGLEAFSGMIAIDRFFLFTTTLLILGTLAVVFLCHASEKDDGIEQRGEFFALLLMATGGAVLFANAVELITMFVGLEILSMALYCLCGASVLRRESAESALKYFLLGSFSSAFLLYGIAMLYGLTGSTFISEILPRIQQANPSVMALSLGLILIGFAFKIAVVPFHFWAPDVYQGAPTPITGYMACFVKASAVAASIRVIWGVFPDLLEMWTAVVWSMSFLTIIGGNLIALRQRDVKRMLAYSSIAHAGYVMAAFLVPNGDFGGGAAILYYLVTYSAMTLGAFAVLVALRPSVKSYDLGSFYGLASKQPYLAAFMALFMLSLTGLPPGMAGLLGKIYVFSAVTKAGFIGLAIVGMLGSAVSCYYYLRVLVAMYFMEASSEFGEIRHTLGLRAVMTVCAVAVIVLGVFPSGLYELSYDVSSGLNQSDDALTIPVSDDLSE